MKIKIPNDIFKNSVIENVVFNIPQDIDHISASIQRTNTFYEADVLQMILPLMTDESVYIDVGANIGNHVICVAANSNAQIIAFEPQQDSLKLLRKNVTDNDFAGRVKVYGFALSDSDREETLHTPNGNAGGAAFSYQASFKDAENKKEKVKVSSLDKVLDVKKYINNNVIIKIDVEGEENKVLLGALDFIKTIRPYIFVENGHLGDCYTLLTSLGYSVIDLAGATPVVKFIPNEKSDIKNYRAVHQVVARSQVVMKDIAALRARLNSVERTIIESLVKIDRQEDNKDKNIHVLGKSFESNFQLLTGSVKGCNSQIIEIHKKISDSENRNKNYLSAKFSQTKKKLAGIEYSANHSYDRIEGLIAKLIDKNEETIKKLAHLDKEIIGLKYSIGELMSGLINDKIEKEYQNILTYGKLKTALKRVLIRRLGREKNG